MKTAISIPDALFEAAEIYAVREGLSRSELYSRALQLYLQAHHAAEITSRLDELYADEPSALDAPVKAAQSRAVAKEDW